MHRCVHVRSPDPKCDPPNPSQRINRRVWGGGGQEGGRCVGRLSLERQQSAAHGQQQRGDGRVLPERLSLQRLLVGLLRGGGALGSRHGGGGQGAAAGTHVVQVSGELRLPRLLPQGFPHGRGLPGAALESGAGTHVERVPGP